MREFSNFPPFNGRAPGILPTNSNATCFAFSSLPQTRTSQSTGSSPASDSAPRFCNAAARLTPAGKSSCVCSAADPCHTPSTRVAAPPTVAANGTVVSSTIVPGFHELFNCFSSAAAPEKGTVKTAISHAAAAEALSIPSICAEPPMRSRNSLAVSCARAGSREPIRICSPALARRYASPQPSAPVPPTIAIFRPMNFHPVSNSALPNPRHFICDSNSPLRFSRTQYGIFKNFQDANLLNFVIRIPQSPGPFHHRRYRGHRRARAWQNSRHDRQLFHIRFARSHADSRLCRPPRKYAFAASKEKTVRPQRPETKSAGHLRILRKTRTQRRNGAAAGHPFSANAQRRPRHRWHASPNELQCDFLARCRRPHDFYRGSGGRGNGGRGAAGIFPWRISQNRATFLNALFAMRPRETARYS